MSSLTHHVISQLGLAKDWPSFHDLRELKKIETASPLGAVKTLTFSLHHTPGRASESKVSLMFCFGSS